MKRLLTLLALAGLSATAVACGDDSGDDGDDKNTTDAAVRTDAAQVRPQQIDTDSLGDACDDNSDCKGAGAVECLKDLGGDTPLPGGYCTAQCNNNAECGPGGKCPLAAVLSNPLFSQFSGLLAGIIPQNCVQTCTVGDAGGRGSCERADHLCRTLIPAELATGQAAALLNGFPDLAKQTYCFPEVEIDLGDAGIPGLGGDAGARALRLGLDAGL